MYKFSWIEKQKMKRKAKDGEHHTGFQPKSWLIFQDAQIMTKLWSNTTKLHRKNHVIYTSLPEDITHWTHAQNDV